MANGIQVGFGIRLSTGGILALGIVGAVTCYAGFRWLKRRKEGRMMMNGGGGMERPGKYNPHAYFAGAAHNNFSLDGVRNRIHNHFLQNARNPGQAFGNAGTLTRSIRSYEVMIRPLVEQLASGEITPQEFEARLQSIIQQISSETGISLQLPPQIIRPDFINHDGSTTDMDLGGFGHFEGLRLPPDKFRFRRHPGLSNDGNEPEIQDFNARQNFAAVTTIGDDDAIQHLPVARSNNVELADDYWYSHAPYIDLAIHQELSKTGNDGMVS